MSLLTSIVAGLAIGYLKSDAWLGFQRAVNVLVVFCPCAFILATPTAISAGIENASRHGILIQSGEALERISECDTIIFFKTGTLTKGNMSISKVQSFSKLSEKEILRVVASGESLLTHPLAQAILKGCQGDLPDVKNHETVKGKGISFEIGGKRYFAGKLSEEQMRNARIENAGFSIVALMEKDSLLGVIFLEDAVKPNAKSILAELKALGKRTFMLTGDNAVVAGKIAEELGISDYLPDCTPEEKMECIRKLEEKGAKVMMLGDGVNDSLALRRAYAGIAMGGIGSDVAIGSADAVLIDDDIGHIPYLFRISKKTQNRIFLNLIASLVINAVAVVLSILGVLNTVWGALYHNVGSVAVVISAFQLLFTKEKKEKQ